MSPVYSIAIAAALLIPVAGTVRSSINLFRLSRRFRSQLCARCGYPLASDQCTECGTTLAMQRPRLSRLGVRHGIALGLWVTALTLVVMVGLKPVLIVRRLPTLAMCRVLALDGIPRSLSQAIDRELEERSERHEIADDTAVDVAGMLFPIWVSKGDVRFLIGHPALPGWKGIFIERGKEPEMQGVYVDGTTADGAVFHHPLFTPPDTTGRPLPMVPVRLSGQPPSCIVHVRVHGRGSANDGCYVFTYDVDGAGKATLVK